MIFFLWGGGGGGGGGVGGTVDGISSVREVLPFLS